ncbi:hypothetical protein [Natronococcus roseus]|uniref:hypothetical protein n=1 Tax=Natronococcus roseus TaxID=1052014 RepID=UPI00374DD7A4
MTIKNAGAAIYGYRPGNESTDRDAADWVIPAQDIDQVQISERGEDLADTAEFSIDNWGGKHTHESTAPDHGDRIEFWLHAPALAEYDRSDRYGEDDYSSDDDLAHEWTGLIRAPVQNEFSGGESYELSFEAGDYVYEILGDRRDYHSYREETPGEIMRTAIEAEAEEIDTSLIDMEGPETNIRANGKKLLELLHECLQRSNTVSWSAGRALGLKPAEEVEPRLETYKGAGDYNSASWESSDDNMATSLRVVGGSSSELDDERDRESGEIASEHDRLTARIPTRKSELHEIEIWIDPSVTDSEESVTVRLQSGDDDGPIAIEDGKSDIEDRTLSEEFLGNDGWVTFEMPSHHMHVTEPWVIAESGGEDGQYIGTDGADNLAYRAHFPFPVNMQVDREEASQRYRRRDEHKKAEEIRTHEAAEDFANGHLDENDHPSREATFEASRPRFHALQVGDLIEVDDPKLGAVGTYVVKQRDTVYDGTDVETSIITRRWE